MIIFLSVIALILSLMGNVMLNFKNKFGYIVWILSNVLWIAINYLDHLNVPQVIMYLTYTLLNVHGFIRWSRNDK